MGKEASSLGLLLTLLMGVVRLVLSVRSTLVLGRQIGSFEFCSECPGFLVDSFLFCKGSSSASTVLRVGCIDSSTPFWCLLAYALGSAMHTAIVHALGCKSSALLVRPFRVSLTPRDHCTMVCVLQHFLESGPEAFNAASLGWLQYGERAELRQRIGFAFVADLRRPFIDWKP